MTDWNWHKATTLDERARLHRRAQGENFGRGQVTERGRKRMTKWKAQPPFDAHPLLKQRFDQAGLTEAEVLELLSDDQAGPAIGEKNGPDRVMVATHAPSETSLSIVGEKPDWASEIERAMSDSRQEDGILFSDKADSRPELLFLELVRPMVARARDRLRHGLQELAETHAGVPLAVDGVERLCLSVLSGRLLWVLMRTMALELNVARVQGLLQGESGEERFASFINRIRQPQVRLELFREYPVLARVVITILDDWVKCSLEVLERWCRDLQMIRETFSPGRDIGHLVALDGEAGDCHRGGRTVWILECSSGFKVVYKPKSMAVDGHFQVLLSWLNERGFSAPFRPMRVLDRGEYGWEEFVSVGSCSSREEVARFYARSGGYAALLYGLAAADFHNENVLAMGEHPVLVDLEALLHPSGLEPAPEQAGDIAADSFGESVLGSGLLPTPIWGGREAGAYDLSGLGAGGKMPMRMPGWDRKGTDEMQFVRETQSLKCSDHRPTLNGVDVTPLDYLDEMEDGFRQVYQLLEYHRDELLAKGGLIERFANDEVRVVLRDSSRYGELLQEGSHPDVLRDGLDRTRLFDRLWEDVVDRPRLAQLIPAEIEDLWRCDIPLFTTRPGSRDIWASKERRFPNLLNESGLDRARQRLEQFGAADLKRQLWFLRGSLTTMASSRRARPRMQLEPESGPNIEPAQLVEASCAVGDRLWEMALRGADDVTWIGLNLAGQKQWMLTPLGLDFYDGVPGIIFFLAHLGAVSGDERYTSLARGALATVRRRIEPSARKKGFKAIGGFVGWGGLLYMLTHLGVLWSEPDLLAEAEQLVEELPNRIEEDKSLDVIAGAAGCIGALLCLDLCRPSRRVLEIASQCGEHLLTKARRMPQGLGWQPAFGDVPLAGFSHGAAGIAWALLELATASGEERFRTAALQAIAYERSLFSPEAGNWMDLRPPESEAEQKTPQFPVAWCHGAPGVGLSRILCGRLVNEPLFKAEIETALRTTVTGGFGYNHCLCHGDLGNLEFLMEAGRALPESAWGEKARGFAAGILKAITREGWLCGNPLALESPGLMTGLAGIGYGLLRCANPAKVPSVLALAPPVGEGAEIGGEKFSPNLA
jgi:type 2 lantibiotic biosynthesis protein LanM